MSHLDPILSEHTSSDSVDQSLEKDNREPIHVPSNSEEQSGEQNMIQSEESYEHACKLFKEEKYSKAAEEFAKALEIKSLVVDSRSLQLAPLYYKYASALYYHYKSTAELLGDKSQQTIENKSKQAILDMNDAVDEKDSKDQVNGVVNQPLSGELDSIDNVGSNANHVIGDGERIDPSQTPEQMTPFLSSSTLQDGQLDTNEEEGDSEEEEEYEEGDEEEYEEGDEEEYDKLDEVEGVQDPLDQHSNQSDSVQPLNLESDSKKASLSLEMNHSENSVDDDDGEPNDLEIAWNVLEIARLIYLNHPDKKIELSDVHLLLGEISMEAEKMEIAQTEIEKALELRQIVNDQRAMAEAYFMLSIIYEWNRQDLNAIDCLNRAKSILSNEIKEIEKNNDQDSDVLNNSEEKIAQTQKTISEIDEKIQAIQDVFTPAPEDEAEYNEDGKKLSVSDFKFSFTHSPKSASSVDSVVPRVLVPKRKRVPDSEELDAQNHSSSDEKVNGANIPPPSPNYSMPSSQKNDASAMESNVKRVKSAVIDH